MTDCQTSSPSNIAEWPQVGHQPEAVNCSVDVDDKPNVHHDAAIEVPSKLRDLNDADTHPVREVRGMDNKRFWVRTFDRPCVELYDAEGFIGKWKIRSSSDIKKQMSKDNQGEYRIKRPGNAVSRVAYNAVMPEDTGEDRWQADLCTWDTIKSLVDNQQLKEEDGRTFWQAWYEARKAGGLVDKKSTPAEESGKDDLMMCSKTTLHGCLAHALGKAQLQNEEDILPEKFMQIIRDTFKAVDEDIVQAPLKLLGPQIVYEPSPLLPSPPPSILGGPNIVSPGSCALTVIYDAAAERVYIANCGDCRAVAGWYDEKKKKWRCDVLTEDHNGDNPSERERVCSDHPEDEREDLFKPNPEMRIFGKLHPTRVFGDHLYKRQYQDWIDFHHFCKQGEPWLTWKKEYRERRKTPPYATAEPDVVWRDLKANEGEELKFIILSTDGLWGRMTSEEAFVLTASTYGDSIMRRSGDMDKQEFLDKYFPGLEDHSPSHPFPREKMDKSGRWALKEEVLPTRLIRNAYGGDDQEERKQIFSIAPKIKNMKDDVTTL
ncbi:hypothetical protein I302_108678 [Kwoniella bestiolae CBS 10118]|uniref:PPM-type phosphatase domain-containing protein n=1 Tax=Kwoniella bestiolae CBS 10118 TaxID=1296100 RepID=A0A1B9FTS1_9TREE|nr:hypothetical protein I302_07813 [Kwoniella bestiolae CBS 10118]OCF22169.1 hypothetical protein I302_07813 [Kwoniella bestiolae CBS 10118]